MRLILVALLAGVMPAAAMAGLRMCNQSYDVLNVALAAPQDDQFVTRGWWRVAPNQCANLLRDPLQSRYYYLFATDVFGNEVLSGAVPMCVATRRFQIDQQQDCLLRGFLDARFIEVDTQDQPEWTVFVTPRPQ
ncbi:MAG: DUF1036 domain-containing protein [Paracoccus sp. (in: a-proteobacteria)]|uniref:DUF1036 domain-containing protein n=1 Tax=Paracoccus sp. TaxID=267 RepID=UPI0026DF6A5B|nr:DUF1036 domain-containing protein [Paracoccus sp. (in: a-proteobacteria)]MDO5622828.1 DUF1036 domain-containing protein [Paracoccus sp. (in: a-proteobacteria)]